MVLFKVEKVFSWHHCAPTGTQPQKSEAEHIFLTMLRVWEQLTLGIKDLVFNQLPCWISLTNKVKTYLRLGSIWPKGPLFGEGKTGNQSGVSHRPLNWLGSIFENRPFGTAGFGLGTSPYG